jgi:hypothetical protein
MYFDVLWFLETDLQESGKPSANYPIKFLNLMSCGMFNRMYLIGSVWDKSKVFESSSRYAISFLLAVFAKQTQCGQLPYKIDVLLQLGSCSETKTAKNKGEKEEGTETKN